MYIATYLQPKYLSYIYRIAQNFDGGKKSDKIWRIKHVRKFDEQNFDKLSYIFVHTAKKILL